MSEWLIGFISGVIAVIIGLILTMLWDNFKFKRESKQREEKVLSAVKEELVSNLDILQYNQVLLQTDIKIIDENKSVIAPLNLLQSGFWDLVKINLPQKLTKGDTLVKIRKAAQLTDQINEQIRSRENHRINNQAMTNYNRRMKLYDETLLESIEVLLKSLEELQPLL